MKCWKRCNPICINAQLQNNNLILKNLYNSALIIFKSKCIVTDSLDVPLSMNSSRTVAAVFINDTLTLKSQPWPADITVLQRFITLRCDRRLVYISSLAATVHTLVPPQPYFTPLIKGSFSLGAVAAITRSKEKQASQSRPAVREQVGHSPVWCSTLSHGTHFILFGQMFWQLTAVPKYLRFIFSLTSLDVETSRQGQNMLMTLTSSTFMPLWRNEASSLEWNTLKTAMKVAKQMLFVYLSFSACGTIRWTC